MTEAQEREQIASKKEHEMKDVLNSQSDAIVVVKTKSTASDSVECLFCNT